MRFISGQPYSQTGAKASITTSFPSELYKGQSLSITSTYSFNQSVTSAKITGKSGTLNATSISINGQSATPLLATSNPIGTIEQGGTATVNITGSASTPVGYSVVRNRFSTDEVMANAYFLFQLPAITESAQTVFTGTGGTGTPPVMVIPALGLTVELDEPLGTNTISSSNDQGAIKLDDTHYFIPATAADQTITATLKDSGQNILATAEGTAATTGSTKLSASVDPTATIAEIQKMAADGGTTDPHALTADQVNALVEKAEAANTQDELTSILNLAKELNKAQNNLDSANDEKSKNNYTKATTKEDFDTATSDLQNAVESIDLSDPVAALTALQGKNSAYDSAKAALDGDLVAAKEAANAAIDQLLSSPDADEFKQQIADAASVDDLLPIVKTAGTQATQGLDPAADFDAATSPADVVTAATNALEGSKAADQWPGDTDPNQFDNYRFATDAKKQAWKTAYDEYQAATTVAAKTAALQKVNAATLDGNANLAAAETAISKLPEGTTTLGQIKNRAATTDAKGLSALTAAVKDAYADALTAAGVTAQTNLAAATDLASLAGAAANDAKAAAADLPAVTSDKVKFTTPASVAASYTTAKNAADAITADSLKTGLAQVKTAINTEPQLNGDTQKDAAIAAIKKLVGEQTYESSYANVIAAATNGDDLLTAVKNAAKQALTENLGTTNTDSIDNATNIDAVVAAVYSAAQAAVAALPNQDALAYKQADPKKKTDFDAKLAAAKAALADTNKTSAEKLAAVKAAKDAAFALNGAPNNQALKDALAKIVPANSEEYTAAAQQIDNATSKQDALAALINAANKALAAANIPGTTTGATSADDVVAKVNEAAQQAANALPADNSTNVRLTTPEANKTAYTTAHAAISVPSANADQTGFLAQVKQAAEAASKLNGDTNYSELQQAAQQLGGKLNNPTSYADALAQVQALAQNLLSKAGVTPVPETVTAAQTGAAVVAAAKAALQAAAAALPGDEDNNVKFATDNSTYKQARQAAQQPDQTGTLTDLVNKITAAQNEYNKLDGQTNLDKAIAAEYPGLTDTQKAKIPAALTATANKAALEQKVAQLQKLGADQNNLRNQVADQATTQKTTAYTQADSDKQTAYDNAVQQAPTDAQLTDIDDATTQKVATASQNITTTKAALNGDRNALIAQLEQLNLTDAQKQAARDAITNAADQTAAEQAVAAAQKLSDARTNVAKQNQLLVELVKSDAYKFADDDRKQALDQAVQALKDADTAQATAEQLEKLLATVVTAATVSADYLNGEVRVDEYLKHAEEAGYTAEDKAELEQQMRAANTRSEWPALKTTQPAATGSSSSDTLKCVANDSWNRKALGVIGVAAALGALFWLGNHVKLPQITLPALPSASAGNGSTDGLPAAPALSPEQIGMAQQAATTIGTLGVIGALALLIAHNVSSCK